MSIYVIILYKLSTYVMSSYNMSTFYTLCQHMSSFYIKMSTYVNIVLLCQINGKKMDTRSLALAGEPSWIRSGIEVFSKGGGLNSHDWIHLVQSAGDYLLAGLFEAHPLKQRTLFALLKVCNSLLQTSSPYTSENRETIDQLKVEVVEALCLVEIAFPSTELCVMLHLLLHVPDSIYRWNAVRNFWCFFGER